MDNRLRVTKFERIYFVAISIIKSKEKIFRFQKIEESLKKQIQRQLRLQLQHPQYAQNQLEDNTFYLLFQKYYICLVNESIESHINIIFKSKHHVYAG